MKISKAIEVKKLIESLEKTNKEIAELQDFKNHLGEISKKPNSVEYAERIVYVMKNSCNLAGLVHESIMNAIKLRTQSLETRKKKLEQDLDDM